MGRLRTKLYDKRDDFNFPIVNFPFVCSNIPAAPAYGVYISHLIDIPELVAPIRMSLIEYEADLSASVVSFISGSMG
jgi:hypothetical protein